jgi:hypothetical protein
MTTPQNPARRRKQKARRAKQLAAWRAANAEKQPTPAKPEAGGKRSTSKAEKQPTPSKPVAGDKRRKSSGLA